MNKTAIKNFAIWARVQLIEAAKQRAYEYEITENGENRRVVDAIGGRLLSKNEKEQRRQLIEQIRQKGYNQVMEEAAYTWFNRFIALRFMEVNGYLPSKVRVFTDENGAFKPEILKQAMSGNATLCWGSGKWGLYEGKHVYETERFVRWFDCFRDSLIPLNVIFAARDTYIFSIDVNQRAQKTDPSGGLNAH